MKKIYIVGIGGIGISAIARYYKQIGYEVFGSDKTSSKLTETLQSEWIQITIGENPDLIDKSFEQLIYSEAIPETQPERQKAEQLWIQTFSYPQSVGNIANKTFFIAIAGTHGKSTTTSMTSLVLKNSTKNFTSIVGTLLTEFWGKNFFHRFNWHENENKEYFVLEACEYKRSFLNYSPDILAITNIELDHLDYYKDEADYISAFASAIKNIKSWGYVILNKNEKNSASLANIRDDIHYIWIDNSQYIFEETMHIFPQMHLQLHGDHILFDAKIAYIVGKILELENKQILESLENYKGVWRRMERVGYTQNDNLVISDYAHHPTEIQKTLSSLQTTFPDQKILTIFQPHQYSRTLELLDDFIHSFTETDILIIPDIYESRDSEEDKQKINTQKFVDFIRHSEKYNGQGFKNTISLLEEFEEKHEKWELVIILMWAGNVDNLREDIVKK